MGAIKNYYWDILVQTYAEVPTVQTDVDKWEPAPPDPDDYADFMEDMNLETDGNK